MFYIKDIEFSITLILIFVGEIWQNESQIMISSSLEEWGWGKGQLRAGGTGHYS